MNVSQITDYLFISSQVKDEHIEAVRKLDPRLAISMIFQTRPPRELEKPPMSVLWLRTVDFVLIPIPIRSLNRGVETALPVIQEGHRVLVFCEGGVHRSVAMASCILIGMGYSADEAMQLVSQKREVADPYAWHIRRQIRKFASYWNKHHPEDVAGNRGTGISS
ncbi:MAG: dual specificity protein phosphatase family protein [Chloroflexota bacterium]|nr:MAG: dual specificity protein phosphatase family protein [Chloroflexota bacterium]